MPSVNPNYQKWLLQATEDERAAKRLLEPPPVNGMACFHFQQQNELALLNRYYIETRYPDDILGVSDAECQQALAAANKIKDFVLSKIDRP